MRALLVLPAAVLAACGPEPAAATPTWHASVRPIVERSCAGCHTDDGIGGFSLTTFEEVVQWSVPVAESVSDRSMPPWSASGDCSTYQDDFSLTDEEIDTVVSWVEAGTPEGDPDTAQTAEPWQAPSLEHTDATLTLPIDYAPVTTPDDYRCFLLEWPFDETVWVTGYEVVPGNATIAHHAIPFVISPDNVALFQAYDDADPDEGYACYGAPGDDVESFATSKWLGAWAPGTGAFLTPEGTGVEIEPGSVVVMQMHYYSTGEEGSDRSALDLQVETTPQRPVKFQPWAELSWLFGDMPIPAQTEGASHTMEKVADRAFSMYSFNGHMHEFGRQVTMTVRHTDGSESCVGDIPEWDFNWQRNYMLAEPVRVEPGDVVELTCTWDNPTDEEVNWGDGTNDEMCLAVTLMDDEA